MADVGVIRSTGYYGIARDHLRGSVFREEGEGLDIGIVRCDPSIPMAMLDILDLISDSREYTR